MRRVWTAIKHGQMHAIANPVRKRRHIQLAYFVLQPSPICITLWRCHLDLSCHHFSRVALLFFDAIGIVLGLEAFEIDHDIFLRHGQAAMPQKLFDRVDINSLFDHIGRYRMSKLVGCNHIGLAFMLTVGSESPQSRCKQTRRKQSLLSTKQVVLPKVMRELFHPFALTSDSRNNSIADDGTVAKGVLSNFSSISSHRALSLLVSFERPGKRLKNPISYFCKDPGPTSRVNTGLYLTNSKLAGIMKPGRLFV